MAKKSLLQEAIAEAKQVRAAAIRNATKELEENLTPSIKEMLAQKLEEELDSDDSNIDENANSGFKEVKPAGQKKVNEAEEDEDDADADAPVDDDDEADDADDADAAADTDDADAAGEDADDADADAPADDEADDNTPLKDITLGDLKQIISDLVAASAAPAPGGDQGADMDPGNVDGMGDEAAAGDIAADADAAAADADAAASDADAAAADADSAADDDDEIDISEILRELEEEEKGSKKVCPKCGKEPCVCNENKQNDEMPENQNGKEHHKEPNEGGPSQDSELNEIKKENEELKKKNKELEEGLKKCTKTLKDANLLNSKLLYTSRLLRQNLSESQKVNVIKTLDEAKSPKEVQSLFKTLVEGLKSSRNLNENQGARRGSASKPAGRSTAGNNLVDEAMVHRFQQLAGIIKD